MKHNAPLGLPSLLESRITRKRQLVTGKVAVGGLPPKVFLWGLAVLIIGGVLYFWNAQAELEEQRRKLLTKQRATAQLLAPKLIPMRDAIESGVVELSKEAKPSVAPGVDWEKLFGSPGIYMRARLADAGDLEKLREVGGQSLRDGFSACLMRDLTAKLPVAGKECKQSNDCESGELCNEYEHCQRPSSPFNMRMLYRALHILSEKWENEVREAGTDYALIAYDRGLDSVTKVDLPVAIDVYQRAKYAIVVLDEDPPGGLPEPLADTSESESERVQRVPHFARIGVWELPSGRRLARVKAEAAGALRDVGTSKPLGGAQSQAARSRQANSCALALDFQSQVLPPEGGAASGGPGAQEQAQ